jgi:hypothetical protein
MKRVVYLYTYARSDGRPPLVLAYLEHYDAARACGHIVEAPDGRRAKAAAVKEHRATCLPVGEFERPHEWHHDGSECDCEPHMLPVPVERRVQP